MPFKIVPIETTDVPLSLEDITRKHDPPIILCRDNWKEQELEFKLLQVASDSSGKLHYLSHFIRN